MARSDAVTLCASAYRQMNLGSLSSFSTSQNYPFNIALDVLNTVIQEMNRKGSYGWSKTETALTYSAGVYTYDLSTLAIDPKRIFLIQRTATDYQGSIDKVEWRQFQELYRRSAILTAMPTYYTVFKETLELNTKPDQDYTIKAYHYKDMPKVTATTDTLLVPETDEDIIIEGVMAFLSGRIGRPDAASLQAAWRLKLNDLLVDVKKDAGLPNQMPANF